MKIKAIALLFAAQMLAGHAAFADVARSLDVATWKVPAPFALASGMGREGRTALAYVAEKEQPYVVPGEMMAANPGESYRASVWVKTDNLRNGQAKIAIEWYDAENRWIYGAYTGGIGGTTAGWQQLSVVAMRLPPRARKIKVALYVEKGAVGKAWFSDVTLNGRGVSCDAAVYAVYCDAYRNTAAHGPVRFFADLSEEALRRTGEPCEARFTLPFAAGRREVPADSLSNGWASVTVSAESLASGTVDVRLATQGGRSLGSAKCSFTRLGAERTKGVWIDGQKRLVIDGKKTFPLGMYWMGINAADLDVYTNGPFNVLMPYAVPNREQLDMVAARGLKTMFNLKSYYAFHLRGRQGVTNEEQATVLATRFVEQYKDHPGLLGWYLNDEIGLEHIEVLTARQRLLERLDPDHPTWTMLWQVDQMRDYMPAFDVSGSDPYPTSEQTWANPYRWPRKQTAGTCAARPLWQAVQVHDHAAYYRPDEKARRLASHVLTKEEIRNMTWQALVGGAHGIFFYSHFDLKRMNWKTPFKDRFALVCEVAREVKAHERFFLSDTPSRELAVDGAPETIVARRWEDGGDALVALVNLTRTNQTARVESFADPVHLAPLEVRLVPSAAELDLAGTWTLTQVETNSVTCPVKVPGGIYTALLDAKYIPDPFWAQNEKLTQWPSRSAWLFARTFDVPAAFAASKSVILRLEDVDCYATIKVNGREVGKTSNRFQRYDFDVKPFLKAGENRIEAHFASTELTSYAETNKYERNAADYRISNATVRKIMLARTVQCAGGWDWGITQMDTGLMGTVKLIAADDARIDYFYTTQTFAPDYSSVDVEVTAEVHSPCGVTTDFTATLGEAAKTERVTLKPGDNRLSLRLRLDKPALWWPNGMGEQPRYPLSVRVGSATAHRMIGLRKIEVLLEDDTVKDPFDAEKGQGMALAVNGVKFFAKGADWIPCDAFENRQTPERYRELLSDAKLCNMNCTRVWGGGQYEKEVFYDTCDELGILVWQDLMFACATYPSSEYFLDGVRKELAHQVRRLRDHCSIALWCGDNECRGCAGARDPELRKRYIRDLRRREVVCGEVCAACDPTRLFWPSSPSQGPDRIEDMAQNDMRGDMHYWQVWFGGRPFDNYYTVRPRFCSEFGFQSYPSPETALTYVSPDQLNPTAPDFFYHQKCPRGNKFILETMILYFRFPKSTRDVFYLSQVQQAMAIKTGVEHFRRLMPRCMGAIYWQLHDNWPVASWSSIEYGGKWKHLQYQAKRFYSPHLVTIAPKFKDPSVLEVWAVNDHGDALKGSVALRNLGFDGRVHAAHVLSADVPPRTSKLLGSFKVDAFGTADERKGRFLHAALSGSVGGEKVSFDNDGQFQYYRESQLCAAHVKAEVSDEGGVWTVTLSTDAPAFFVWADAPGIKGVFSDNSFTLVPGRAKTITFEKRPYEKATFADFKKAFTLTHLRQSYE